MSGRWALPVALLAGLSAAAPARAGTITSKNWAGYAIHRAGTSFRHASATWRQPAASCQAGQETSAAFWVGIGGYKLSSSALDQIGTELDCAADGTASISAWYETVPSPTRDIAMTIAAGDSVSASVDVRGRRVRFRMVDRTTGASYAKSIRVAHVDASSAEWIAEAPSSCTSSACHTLTLTDFGTMAFAAAGAQTTRGQTVGLSGAALRTTKLLLGYTAAADGSFTRTASTANATPTQADAAGHAFAVSYSASTSSTGSAATSPSTGSGGGRGPFPGGGPGGGGGGAGPPSEGPSPPGR